MHVYMCACLYVCTHACICLCEYMYVRIYIHICVCINVRSQYVHVYAGKGNVPPRRVHEGPEGQ
jgi:hypothetical protein